MKNLFLVVLVSIIVMSLNSCTTSVISNFNDLSMLRKGMDTATINRIFDNTNLQDRQTFSVPNTPYTVKKLSILVQLKERVESKLQRVAFIPSTGAVVSQRVNYTEYTPIYNPFALVFENGKLIYWGFQYEFNMSENPEILKIGAVVWQGNTSEGK